MKRVVKVVLLTMAALIFTVFLCIGFLIYQLNYAVETVAQAESPDKTYVLELQSVGSPIFFSSADGRLVLKEGRRKVAVCDFVLSDDGGAVRSDIWQVFWEVSCVRVIISGSEQGDEQIKITYGGKVSSKPSRAQRTEQSDSGSRIKLPEEKSIQEYETERRTEQQAENQRIMEGYQAVYDNYFLEEDAGFIEDYDAKGNSRIILREDESVIEYLVYDRESQNGTCGLYVYYRTQKEEDGSWSPMEAAILDIYAYVYEEGEVISSGKTNWSDAGSEAYQEATGE